MVSNTESKGIIVYQKKPFPDGKTLIGLLKSAQIGSNHNHQIPMNQADFDTMMSPLIAPKINKKLDIRCYMTLKLLSAEKVEVSSELITNRDLLQSQMNFAYNKYTLRE